MITEVKVGQIYKNVTGRPLFVVRYDEEFKDFTYYFLEDPDTLLQRYIEDSLRHWNYI